MAGFIRNCKACGRRAAFSPDGLQISCPGDPECKAGNAVYSLEDWNEINKPDRSIWKAFLPFFVAFSAGFIMGNDAIRGGIQIPHWFYSIGLALCFLHPRIDKWSRDEE